MTKRLSKSPDSFLPLTPVAFEILLALAEGERHGYDVMIEVERRTGGRISPNPGTLYRALDRLVQEGQLTSAVRSVDGESRRVFSMSPLGRAVARGDVPEPDPDTQADMFQLACAMLRCMRAQDARPCACPDLRRSDRWSLPQVLKCVRRR